MRKEFSEAVENLAAENNRVVFITGDLGFNAFENLKRLMGNRFINAGVAEQSMVSIAAGMASKGYQVICYSIAPFLVFRPLEQIRNDICFHDLPVVLVGNGGGFGYGIMGSTHHAINDLACLCSLPNIQCWIPSFTDEVEPVLREIIVSQKPAYLRLANSTPTPELLSRDDNFKIVLNNKNALVTIIALGPLAAQLFLTFEKNNCKAKVDLFACIKLPIVELTSSLVESIRKTKKVFVIEEHVETGGLGQSLSVKFLESNIQPDTFVHRHAKYYPLGLYGNQLFHQQESRIDPASILEELKKHF